MAIAIIELLNYTINTANDIVKEDLEQLFIHNTFVSKFWKIVSNALFSWNNSLFSLVVLSDKLHGFSVSKPRCYKDISVNSFFSRIP